MHRANGGNLVTVGEIKSSLKLYGVTEIVKILHLSINSAS